MGRHLPKDNFMGTNFPLATFWGAGFLGKDFRGAFLRRHFFRAHVPSENISLITDKFISINSDLFFAELRAKKK